MASHLSAMLFFSCPKLQLKELVNMNIISEEGQSADCNDVYRNILSSKTLNLN
jgi:hypothetical protein